MTDFEFSTLQKTVSYRKKSEPEKQKKNANFKINFPQKFFDGSIERSYCCLQSIK